MLTLTSLCMFTALMAEQTS